MLREVQPKGIRKFEVPAPGRKQQEQLRIRRSLADMPAPSKQLNFISVVCLYTLIGLSDRDISIALSCDVEQVERIKMLDAYSTVYEFVVKSILEEDADDVRQMFGQHAKTAAKKLVNLIDSEDDVVALRASADILDRAGHRPADVVEVRGKLENTLRVEIVEKKDEDVPVIIDGKNLSD